MVDMAQPPLRVGVIQTGLSALDMVVVLVFMVLAGPMVTVFKVQVRAPAWAVTSVAAQVFQVMSMVSMP
jgi:hypothetical protein